MPYRRKKMHDGDTHLRRRWRLRNRKKDLDQIDNDLKTNPEALLSQEVDLEKPGFAQFYCIHCATYYISQRAMEDHFRTKVHKRRLKALEIEPYTHKEAEQAAGHGSFTQPQKRKMETQPTKEELAIGKKIRIETDEEMEKPVKVELSKVKHNYADVLNSIKPMSS